MLDSQTFFDDGASWSYSGVATNNSGMILDSALAWVEIYNAAGNLVGYSYDEIPGEILAGSQNEFNILLWRPQGSSPDDYAYRIQVLGFYR